MKFTINSKKLCAALGKLSSLTGGKTTMPILSTIRLTAEEGKITMVATNLTTFLEMELEADVSEDGAACVSPSSLIAIASRAGRVPTPFENTHACRASLTLSSSVERAGMLTR